MQVLLAASPIVVLLFLMIVLRLGGHIVGPLSWLFCLLAGCFAFGVDTEVFAVSQLKGLTLSFFVVSILWAALLLYNVVNARGGIQGIADGLRVALGSDDLLKLVLAWCFSGNCPDSR